MTKLSLYLQVIRFDKPIGTLLLLWPTLAALFLTYQGNPPWALIFIFALGAFIMRSLGCLINDYTDKNIDKHVQRTKNRPFASSLLTKKDFYILFISLLFCAFLLFLALPNTAKTQCVIALFLACIYPFSKRFFVVPQLFLAMAYSWSIVVVFSTHFTPELMHEISMFFLINVFWVLGYDSIYALMDLDDDKHLPIHSSPLFFQDNIVFFISICFSLVGLLFLIHALYHQSLALFIGYSAACFFLVNQLIILRKSPSKAQLLQSFKNNNWVGLCWFLGIFIYTI